MVTAVLATGLGLSACGIGQAVEQPINALGATDVVVETNLQAASQAAQSEYSESSSYSSFGAADSPDTGVSLTPDPSTFPNVVSYAVTADGQALVLAAYNKATEDCLGVIQIAGSTATPILGESAGGVYDFKDSHIVSTGCDAGRYMTSLTPMPGWPSGDPTESPNWPS